MLILPVLLGNDDGLINQNIEDCYFFYFAHNRLDTRKKKCLDMNNFLFCLSSRGLRPFLNLFFDIVLSIDYPRDFNLFSSMYHAIPLL